MLQLHPMGILLGFAFVIAIGILFYWMFRVPPALPLPVIRVRRSLSAVRKILVPIGETMPSERAVELACRLGREQKAELVLVHVIAVPLTMELQAPQPEKEKEGRQALDLGHMIAERYGMSAATRLVHDRRPADGVLRVAREEGVDAIVLGVGYKSRGRIQGSDWGQTTSEIVRRAPCEVIVDKVLTEAQRIEQVTPNGNGHVPSGGQV